MVDRIKDRAASIVLYIVAVLVIGEIVAFAVLIPLAGKVSAQSRAGQKARVTQCALAPISMKLYVDAESRGAITDRDLGRINSALVQACGPRK